MKNLLYITLALFIITSCKKATVTDEPASIVGKWKATSTTVAYYLNNKLIHIDTVDISGGTYYSEYKSNGQYIHNYTAITPSSSYTLTGTYSVSNDNTLLNELPDAQGPVIITPTVPFPLSRDRTGNTTQPATRISLPDANTLQLMSYLPIYGAYDNPQTGPVTIMNLKGVVIIFDKAQYIFEFKRQ